MIPSRYSGPSMSAKEAIGRERKVRLIADYLRSCDVTPEEAARYSKDERLRVAIEAGALMPSERSWQSVLEKLRTGHDLNIVDQLRVSRDPLELADEICVWCHTGPANFDDHGRPAHRLCADQAAYDRQVEREVMAADEL